MGRSSPVKEAACGGAAMDSSFSYGCKLGRLL